MNIISLLLLIASVEATENNGWHSKLGSSKKHPLASFKDVFGYACPMRWLETSGASFPSRIDRRVEYLPDQDMTKCDDNLDADTWRAQGHGEGQIMLAASPPGHLTIGKEIERHVSAALAAAESQSPAFKFGFIDPKGDKWARTLHCRPNVGMHQCMFGERENTSLPVTGDLTLAKAFWDSHVSSARASYATKWTGSDPPTQFRAVVSRGWISYRMAPFTACSGFRSCGSAKLNAEIGVIGERVFVSVHIRMGDACNIVLNEARPYKGTIWGTLRGDGVPDRPCIAPAGYEAPLLKMKKLYGVTDVLLATDSPAAVEWAKTYTGLPVYHFEWDRAKLGGTNGGAWVEHRETEKSEVEAALLGVELLSYGHVLIGNMCSYYTNAIFDAMNGRRNTIVPYMSLDGCAMHAHPSIPFNS